MLFSLLIIILSDGWTKTDLIYVWKSEGALQFADNLSLPGGFLLANTGNQYCDVVTSTGQANTDYRSAFTIPKLIKAQKDSQFHFPILDFAEAK